MYVQRKKVAVVIEVVITAVVENKSSTIIPGDTGKLASHTYHNPSPYFESKSTQEREKSCPLSTDCHTYHYFDSFFFQH